LASLLELGHELAPARGGLGVHDEILAFTPLTPTHLNSRRLWLNSPVLVVRHSDCISRHPPASALFAIEFGSWVVVFVWPPFPVASPVISHAPQGCHMHFGMPR
jgi:hypothetical protein